MSILGRITIVLLIFCGRIKMELVMLRLIITKLLIQSQILNESIVRKIQILTELFFGVGWFVLMISIRIFIVASY